MSLERVRAAAAALKVFPLPSCVLFPGAAQPLHIFEPRYRALVKDALATDKVMAIAQLEPGWESDYPGRPPLISLCCAGLIAWHEALPDGRFNVILQGVVRTRVLQELPPRADYREARVQLLPDAAYEGPEEDLLRHAVLEITGRVTGSAGRGLLQAAAHASGGALADIIASALVQDVERRQAILAQLDVKARMAAVLDELSELIAQMGPPGSEGPLN